MDREVEADADLAEGEVGLEAEPGPGLGAAVQSGEQDVGAEIHSPSEGEGTLGLRGGVAA